MSPATFQTPQLAINFTPGVLEQLPDFMDAVRADVYGCGRQFKAIAADCDMSASELSRRLNDDPADLPFRARDLLQVLNATPSNYGVRWLVERYLADPEAKRAHATERLAQLMPHIAELLHQAGATVPKAKR